MTFIVMEYPPDFRKLTLVHLCDFILERLHIFAKATSDIEIFCDEVRTLERFLDLIDRIFKAKSSRLPFEEQHYSSVEDLLGRCRTTLSRLCIIFASIRSRQYQAESQDRLEEILRLAQSSEVVALRGKVDFYIQTLQMSLQTVKL